MIRAVAIGAIRKAWRELPEEIRARLANITVKVAELPDAKDLERGATPTHRGYFWGHAPEPVTTTEIPDDQVADGEIVIFWGVHASIEELGRTLAHEIAHCLGHSEEEICDAMGLGS
jgi:predicted Zn-dependent protease with MMP-like domain